MENIYRVTIKTDGSADEIFIPGGYDYGFESEGRKSATYLIHTYDDKSDVIATIGGLITQPGIVNYKVNQI